MKNLINFVKESCYVRETYNKVLKNVCKCWQRFVQFENNSRNLKKILRNFSKI